MKILVAEDEPISSKYLTGVLRKLGHEFVATRNGHEALTEFLTGRPAVVISDWMMPTMDGIELCQQIRGMGLEQYTFFILQTAKTGRADYLRAMDAGVDDFLSKPVNQEEIAIRLRVAERIIRQRADAERRLRLLTRFPADNPNPVLQVDRTSRILYANLASLALLANWQSGVGGVAPEKLRRLVDLLCVTGRRQEVEIPCADRVFSFSATSLSDEGVIYLYGHDITTRKQAEAELIQLKEQAEEHALHDQLTGLPNRRLLTERLHQETARATRQGTKLGLVVVDIDNFKQINDGYGHKVGDQVIVTVGQCLRQMLRNTDTVCRWGGDELVLLLTDLNSREVLAPICEKLIQAVKRQTAEAGITAPVSLSLGSAIFPDDAQETPLLMQQADHALYVAKADGRNCWREFKSFPKGHDAKGVADVFIALSAAVAEKKITTFFQPIIDAETLRVSGAETLARWHDEQHGWVSPDVFIPLAEDKGLILQLGQLVLEQAMDQLVDWRRRGLDLTVSVNVSKRQLLDGNFLSHLLEEAARRGVKPEWLVLEITERQSVLEQALARQRLEALAAAGFRLAIDDFGSGYSSFDMVGEVAFSELKIHLGLVRMIQTPRGHRVIQAIVEMGRSMGLRVVAEGVEDEATQAMLLSLGVHKLQGYLFSKPLQPGAFLAFAETHNVKQRRAA
jgi:diguanylate cyclase (GGDEF)-like protein